jgi:DNA-binding IclR family transcriptional regulator
MNDQLGGKTRILLRDFITSFEMLEVLLLLRATAAQSWTVRAVSDHTHIAEDLIARALASLEAHRFIEAGESGGKGSFRYRPGTEDLAAAADELAADFAERRAAVLSTLSTNAIERLRSGAINAFADAFVLGRKHKDG